MTGTDPIPSPRHTWITIGYVVVAIGFCFVPGIGFERFPAPRSQVLAGGIATAIALGAVHLFRDRWPTVVVVAGLTVMIVEAGAFRLISVCLMVTDCVALCSL